MVDIGPDKLVQCSRGWAVFRRGKPKFVRFRSHHTSTIALHNTSMESQITDT